VVFTRSCNQVEALVFVFPCIRQVSFDDLDGVDWGVVALDALKNVELGSLQLGVGEHLLDARNGLDLEVAVFPTDHHHVQFFVDVHPCQGEFRTVLVSLQHAFQLKFLLV